MLKKQTFHKNGILWEPAGETKEGEEDVCITLWQILQADRKLSWS